MKRFVVMLLALPLVTSGVRADDWPMYMGNPGRTGYVKEHLADKLTLAWTLQSAHTPMPAWPSSDRQPYDQAFHPVIAKGTLFYGSSADGRVHAVDAATGEYRWSVFTDGPVRFAPAVWQDHVLVASDDGYLYCLHAGDGKLAWKHRGGPSNEMILGNDRLISRWPARGGPVVVGDTVYYGAGIWPSDGIYLYALDARSGEVRWKNDEAGSIYMGQPHGGAYANSGVSAQGHLAATKQHLLVPTGRAVPSVFQRDSGKFLYFELQPNAHRGGTTILALDDLFINSGASFDLGYGGLSDKLGTGEVAAWAEGLVSSSEKTLTVSRWVEKQQRTREGKFITVRSPRKSWTAAVAGGNSVIVAGNTAICGGEGVVNAVDLTTEKVLWSARVDGVVWGLAVADGRLYASTDRGAIHCLTADNVEKPRTITEPVGTEKYPADPIHARAAEEILKKVGITEGVCVDLGCGDGSLAHELAKRSKLTVHAYDADANMVALARKRLTAAGLYGKRVTVHHGKPAECPFPKYFANLIVSGRVAAGEEVDFGKQVTRLQRPFGGMTCLGVPGKMEVNVRGPLAGAGNWTHQYADPANTCCSADDLVKGPLEMLWFRDSDFPMPQRHGRGPAPLFHDGVLVVEGMHGIRAVDSYNGRTLWEYDLPSILSAYNADHLVGTAATGSNICVTKDGVYVRTADRCLRLDLNTGKKLGEFVAPAGPDGKAGTWGFLACEDGILFGSLANTDHVVRHAYRLADMSSLFSESRLFFALDARTGKELWKFRPAHSIRHNAIAIGSGRVFLIDRPLAAQDLAKDPRKEDHPPGKLIALDAKTGEKVWNSPENVQGTLLALSVPENILVVSYQNTRFRLPSEAGDLVAGYDTVKGTKLWEEKGKYLTRPMIVGKTVYAQGGAWDLRTGEARPFNFKRSYGCGQISSSNHLMLFRSATLGYFDIDLNQTKQDYGGMRPGCWINAIPVGGVVLVPDASAGCRCSYLNQAWVALQGKE